MEGQQQIKEAKIVAPQMAKIVVASACKSTRALTSSYGAGGIPEALPRPNRGTACVPKRKGTNASEDPTSTCWQSCASEIEGACNSEWVRVGAEESREQSRE